MKMIERLSLVEKTFMNHFNLSLETFYNVACTSSTVFLQGSYNSVLARALNEQVNLIIDKQNGFITGTYIIPSEIEGVEAVTVEITLT